jgi:hypothetical protein
MYLENIFSGSDDIRTQLPAEAAQFDAVHAALLACMKGLHAIPNVVEVRGNVFVSHDTDTHHTDSHTYTRADTHKQP